MALLLTVATGAWAQDPDPIDLTPSADGTVWTLSTMPEYDVELEVTYYTDAELDRMAADEVIAKIAAIGTVTYTAECKTLIDAARTAYDALTTAQKALVTNISTLTGAETTYATAEETAYIEGVELIKNPDGSWSLASMPGFDIELEIEYYDEPAGVEGLVYTGEAQTLIVAAEAAGYTFQYKVGENGEYSADLPTATDAGSYTVYYKATAAGEQDITGSVEVSIAKAALTITAENKDTIYGDPAPALTVTYTGLLGEDTPAVVSGLTLTSEYVLTSNVGEYDIVPADATAQNYAISYTKGTLTVNKAPLMITADDKEVTYGDEHPAFTASYEGWKNADDESVVSGLTLTSEYVLTSNVGEYDIVPANAEAQNYAISYTNGTLTVNQAPLTITAEDKSMFYGNEAPEFTVTYAGWKNEDNEAVVSGLKYTCEYQPGSYIGAYSIEPNSATAQNYAITFVDGTLTVNKAAVIVSGAKVQIAKFEDGTTDAVVLDKGILNGVMLNDPVDHITTASFSDATVGEHKTIRVNYALTGNPVLLLNYDLILTAENYIEEGVIIENFVPAEEGETEKENDEAQIEEGIEVYAYGYCDGSGYSLRYHLNSGNPDQYKIDFDDSRFTWLESKPMTVTFHVNLPETYVVALFDNVMAVVDTCECLTDIQWYWRANSTDQWQAIEGATGYYYKQEGGLSGEYFIKAKMNGVDTYTCSQDDMSLYGDTKQAKVSAYPNPVVNTTTVTIENSYNYEHKLRIVNLMGIEMMTTSFEGNTTSVEMGTFPQGHYMISVDGVVVKVMKK